jgi:hypothetical protein
MNLDLPIDECEHCGYRVDLGQSEAEYKSIYPYCTNLGSIPPKNFDKS